MQHRALALTLTLALTVGCATAADVRAADAPTPHVPDGFTIERIATVPGARELVATPNGDVLVGTTGNTIQIVPDAQGTPGSPRTFATFDDRPVAGVTLAGNTLYAGTVFGVYRLPYHPGDRATSAKPEKIASVRTSGESGGHTTTTVAFSKGILYASVGSSCNACDPELDATRATIQAMTADGKDVHPRAVHIRNAIALAVNPADGGLWAGVAGRDDLPHGHPYEIFDDVTAHPGTPDYGWLTCYDDRKPVVPGADCGKVVVPRAVFPGYDTPIGAAFYPENAAGRYAFPAAYRGGAFVTLHGSWHTPPVPPRVAFVPFKGALPAKAVDWTNPDAQWTEFLSGCQTGFTRVCRPTGVAVGSDGTLFVSTDDTGAIYRIRPRPH